MMGGVTGAVESMGGYLELRKTVALACGVAVVKHEYRRDPGQVEIELNVVNDFTSPHKIHQSFFSAANLTVLAEKLA
jgi:hypothetical protein